MEKGVGVEQHRVAALGLVQGQIVGRAKAQIHMAADEADGGAGSGELVRHHFRRAVAGGVVHHQHLGGHALGQTGAFGKDGLQAIPQQVVGVERDHDDRNRVGVGGKKFHGRATLRRAWRARRLSTRQGNDGAVRTGLDGE